MDKGQKEVVKSGYPCIGPSESHPSPLGWEMRDASIHCMAYTTLHGLYHTAWLVIHCMDCTTLHCLFYTAMFELHCMACTTLHCLYYTVMSVLHSTVCSTLHCLYNTALNWTRESCAATRHFFYIINFVENSKPWKILKSLYCIGSKVTALLPDRWNLPIGADLQNITIHTIRDGVKYFGLG